MQMCTRCVPGAVALLALTAPIVAAQPTGGAGSLEFDGIDDSVTAVGDFTTEQITIEAWVRPESVHPLYTAGIVSYGSPTESSFDFGIGAEGDRRLRFFINWNQGQKTIIGATALSPGQWRHLAATYDGATARLFIDGQLDAEQSFEGASILPSGEGALLAIGDDYPGASEFLGGGFDEVRIWTVARSEAQIRENMHAALTGDEPGILALYNFDECGSQVILDASQNALHARRGRSLTAADDDPARVRDTESRLRCLTLSSTAAGLVRPIEGEIESQLDQINAGPPADGYTPITNRHADLHARDAFPCGENLERPYVDSKSFLAGADEVTLDNCASAFYRFEFQMPPVIGPAAVYGAANADDLAVAFLNDVPISPLLGIDDVADLGADRTADRRRLLGWPTADPLFENELPRIVAGGVNRLDFGVCSDASESEPAGLEFEIAIVYECLADWNADGRDDTIDFCEYLNAWTARESEADLNRDERINTADFLLWLNVWTFGCPQ